MNRSWKKIKVLIAVIVLFALMASTNIFVQHEEKFQSKYKEQRLQNDSLMGAMQTLQKHLWEKEQELMKKNISLDSLSQVCNHPIVILE